MVLTCVTKKWCSDWEIKTLLPSNFCSLHHCCPSSLLIMSLSSTETQPIVADLKGQLQIVQLNVVFAHLSPCCQLAKLYVTRATTCLCNLHVYKIFARPCYGTLPKPAPSKKTSILYRLQPLDGNAPNLHVFIFLLFANFKGIEKETSRPSWPSD